MGYGGGRAGLPHSLLFLFVGSRREGATMLEADERGVGPQIRAAPIALETGEYDGQPGSGGPSAAGGTLPQAV